MRTPAPIENFVAAKRSGIALLVFGFGLLAIPAVFAAGAIYHRLGCPASWLPALDYFDWLAAALGPACCLSAAFIPAIPMAQKAFLSFVASVFLCFDIIFSAVVLFGFLTGSQ